MNVSAAHPPMGATLSVTFADVVLVEVTLGEFDYVSTPVPGGSCLHIEGPLAVEYP